jgi:hypothetical protein
LKRTKPVKYYKAPVLEQSERLFEDPEYLAYKEERKRLGI